MLLSVLTLCWLNGRIQDSLMVKEGVEMCISVPSSTIHISWSNCLEEETISPNFLRSQ